MSEKKILLIGGNYWPEPIGIGKYNGEMIDWLSKNDIECTVVTSYPYYPHWKVQEPYTKGNKWFKKEVIKSTGPGTKDITIYRCPQYTPSNPSGMTRMLLDLSFSLSCFIIVIKLLFQKKHSHVISVVPSFQIGLAAILYKFVTKAKFLYHIQDLQIDAAKDLGMINSKLLLKYMFKIEAYILRKADIVSSISAGMIRKINAKIDKGVVLFPNWVDTETLFPIENKVALKHKFGFEAHEKVVLYSGALGQKQGIEAILQTANDLRHLQDLKFVICGSGPYKPRLQEIAETLRLTNVVFLPLQPFEEFNNFLNMADLHLVIQKKNASDLVMPSKLTGILAIGGAVLVTAPSCSTLFEVIQENQMGILIEPEDQKALNKAVELAVINNDMFIKNNARAYAMNFLYKDNILSRYFEGFVNDKKLEKIPT
ncbi:WcaI family glycosyltransferase [Mucilaginibacter myungsuensis]|uniref:WcaI family glycosyltransferase n=1 Tax=Mucilaginibacter myungsuensis TaxID=649104 RepID=A0A929KXE3_9SPHI|nr:WcaI family glycosyltransferase [Mucilaginibacter myungsuensis]MBE9660405.1 WcaI family glycosyltransferase [Mucilaginibacter myungsuensis]MDN3600448.1 WcaI family glycosyltransferase [Mucilaginibacter myungsuensis]